MTKHGDQIRKAIQNLRGAKQAHLDIAKYMMKELFPLDFLAFAVLNRSLCLLSGFCTLIEARNIISATPLFRMQLDNCLRFSAAWIVEKPHDFALQVLSGVPIRKLKDQNGNLMTDRHLVETLAIEYPWIRPTYDHSSGYIHLSEKHIFNCMSMESEAEGTINFKISDHDEHVPTSLYLEVVEAFTEATKVLLKYTHGWAFTKNNPKAVAEMRRLRDE